MGNFNRGGGRSFGGGGSRGGFGGGGRRDGERPQMHRATCAECGDSCQVPFKPTGDKPVFCSECFGKQQDNGGGRSNDRGGRGGFGGDRRERRPREDREMHDVVCDECSKDCQVPFKPSPGKAILCDECFSKSRNKGRGGDSSEVMEQIKKLNEKMDKLITLLDPKASKKVEDKKEEKKPKLAKDALGSTSAKTTVGKKKTEKKIAVAKTKANKKKVVAKKAPAKKKK